MEIKKKQVISLAILILIVILLFALVINESFNSYKKINEMDNHLTRIMLTGEISEDIIRTIAAVQDYILYSDRQYLDDFRRNSAIALKHQLELYNLVNPSKKQDIEDLIELSKAYNSFVEREAIPAIQTNSGNDIKYLQLRHKDFIWNLTGKADAVLAAGRNEVGEYFKETIIGKSIKVVALLISLILAIFALAIQIVIILKPYFLRQAYLEKLFERTKSAVISVDHSGSIKDLNKSARDLLGFSANTILPRNVSEIPVFYPHLRNVTEPLYDVIVQGQELSNHRVTCLYAGRKIEIVADYVPLFISNRLAGALMLAAQAETQKDKHVLLDTLEAERKRISIEIHDWIGRHMSTMIHSLDYILRFNNSDAQSEARENLLALRANCQNAAIEMRDIMNDIHPYLIDRVGLISSLESYISTFERLNNIKVYIYYQDRSLRVKKKDEIIIYRIIQEALTNVAKHGESTEIDIDFTVSNDKLKIEVADNGSADGDFTAGKGLWGMRERANLIGGDIDFIQGGSGFCVTLTVPILPGGLHDDQN